MTEAIDRFAAAANAAAGHVALCQSADGQLKTMGWIKRLTTPAARNRQVMGDFLAALRQRYGDGIAGMAAPELAAHWQRGSPLMAGRVRAILSRADAIERALDAFVMGAPAAAGDQEVAHSLDKALRVWRQRHPAEWSAAELWALKADLCDALRRGDPPCCNAEAMYQAVTAGEVSPLKEMAAWAAALSEDVPTALAAALPADLVLHAGELARLQAEVEARLSIACHRREALDKDAVARFCRETLSDFSERVQAIAAAGLPPEKAEAQRRLLFIPANLLLGGSGGANERHRLVSAACQRNSLTQARNELLQRRLLAASAPDSLLKRKVAACLRGSRLPLAAGGIDCGKGRVVKVAPELLDEFARKVQQSFLVLQAGQALAAPLTEQDVAARIDAVLAGWAEALAALAKLRDCCAPEEFAFLARRALAGFPPVSASYLADLRSNLLPLSCSADDAGATLAPLISGDAWALEVMSVNLLYRLTDACQTYAVASEDWTAFWGDVIEMGVIRMAATPELLRALYQGFQTPTARALRHRLAQEMGSVQASMFQFAMLDLLHRSLGARLDLPPARVAADF